MDTNRKDWDSYRKRFDSIQKINPSPPGFYKYALKADEKIDLYEYINKTRVNKFNKTKKNKRIVNLLLKIIKKKK